MKTNTSQTLIKLTVLCTILFACQSEKGLTSDSFQVFQVSNNELAENISDISTKVETILLETTDENLISRVMSVSHNNQTILVSDLRAVFKFKMDGTYLDRIGNEGEGPGEYKSVISTAVDWTTGYIFVSTYNKIIVYNLEGEFLREEKIAAWIDGINIIDDRLHAFITERGFPSTNPNKSLTKTFLLSLNNDLKVTDSLLVKSVEVDKGSATALGYGMNFISHDEDNEYLYFPVVSPEKMVRDTLYRISNGTIMPALKVDFGIRDRLEEKFGISSIIKSKNYILTNFYKDSKSQQSIINLSSSKSIIGTEGFDDDIFKTGKVMLKPWNLENDEFYFVKDAYELEGIINGVTEDDNPVLFIMKVSN